MLNQTRFWVLICRPEKELSAQISLKMTINENKSLDPLIYFDWIDILCMNFNWFLVVFKLNV